jgi:DNA-binding MarR family transcriptional regulator
MATLAALPEGDALSFTRLQDQISLTPGNLITHLRKLEDAGYIESQKSGKGTSSLTTIILTTKGHEALDSYADALRALLEGL